MELTLDLHSHSGYSGGVGKINLEKIEQAMVYKGLDVFGTGDCLHPLWYQQLVETLEEKHPGLYGLKKSKKNKYFLLQTEVIFSYPLGNKRKSFHLLLLLPHFSIIPKIQTLLENWSVKNSIGRPFIVCVSQKQLVERLMALQELDEWIEIIPAHILTPDGVLGSENPIDSLEEVFGDFTPSIRIIETGLSADPLVLSLIPELDHRVFISNSDTHSADLKRIGREFTRIKTQNIDYQSIINALRKNHIIYTGEFSVTEGRYFLTGHRQGKKGHEQKGIFFFPHQTPENKLCPECGKILTIGVLERAIDLAQKQGRKIDFSQNKRPFITLAPLIEVLAFSLQKGENSKIVQNYYFTIVEKIAPETLFWQMEYSEIEKNLLLHKIDDPAIRGILEVKKGNFCYEPLGFDGQYGQLVIGKRMDWRNYDSA